MDGYALYKPFAECSTLRAVYDLLRSLSEEELRALQAWLIASTNATRAWIESAEKDTNEDYIAKGYDMLPGRRDCQDYQFDLGLLHHITLLLDGKSLPEPPNEEPVVPPPSAEKSWEAWLAETEAT